MAIFLYEFIKLLIYFIICASCALIIRRFTRVPEEIYRKLLHIIVVCSAPVLLYTFSSWQNAVLASIFFAAIIYPVLSLAEHLKCYSNILAERNRGEIKRSLIAVFAMFTVIITICWGMIGAKYLAIAVILGWGLGDATAALVGKKFGKRHFKWKFVDNKKTYEGTLAMFVVSFISIISILILNSVLPWHGYIPAALISAGAGSFVELSTKNGLDTITCPAAILAILLPLIHLWGGVL